MVWELREHDIDQVMREVRDALRYWEEQPDDAEAVVRVALTSGRFHSPFPLSASGLRAAVSQAVATGATDFRSIATRYGGLTGRLERLYKRFVRKSTGWLFFRQLHTNHALALAVEQLAEEIGRLSDRVRRLEARSRHGATEATTAHDNPRRTE
jgi:hypothetical protein